MAGVEVREARRKVLFFRAVPDPVPDGEPEPAWDPAAICAKIAGWEGDKAAYYEDSEGVNRAEIGRSAAPQGIRFLKVRRDELPGVDDGSGDRTDLDLDPDEGLVEAIHICLFPDRVIAAEFFFYGPRVSRFERYLRNKLDVPCSLRQMARHEVIDQALAYDEIRLVRIKLDPSAFSTERARDEAADEAPSLEQMMRVASDFHASVYADVTLRSEPHSSGFKERVKALLRSVKEGSTDPEIFERLEIDGKPTPDAKVTPLDVLSERLYRMVDIPYRVERYRDLNSDAAFAAIRAAHAEAEADLAKDTLA